MANDIVGNIKMYNGLNLNKFDEYFLLNKESLEKLSTEVPAKGWIPSHAYQIGGSLYKRDVEDKTEIRVNTQLSNQKSFGNMGLFGHAEKMGIKQPALHMQANTMLEI